MTGRPASTAWRTSVAQLAPVLAPWQAGFSAVQRASIAAAARRAARSAHARAPTSPAAAASQPAFRQRAKQRP